MVTYPYVPRAFSEGKVSHWDTRLQSTTCRGFPNFKVTVADINKILKDKGFVSDDPSNACPPSPAQTEDYQRLASGVKEMKSKVEMSNCAKAMQRAMRAYLHDQSKAREETFAIRGGIYNARDLMDYVHLHPLKITKKHGVTIPNVSVPHEKAKDKAFFTKEELERIFGESIDAHAPKWPEFPKPAQDTVDADLKTLVRTLRRQRTGPNCPQRNTRPALERIARGNLVNTGGVRPGRAKGMFVPPPSSSVAHGPGKGATFNLNAQKKPIAAPLNDPRPGKRAANNAVLPSSTTSLQLSNLRGEHPNHVAYSKAMNTLDDDVNSLRELRAAINKANRNIEYYKATNAWTQLPPQEQRQRNALYRNQRQLLERLEAAEKGHLKKKASLIRSLRNVLHGNSMPHKRPAPGATAEAIKRLKRQRSNSSHTST